MVKQDKYVSSSVLMVIVYKPCALCACLDFYLCAVRR